VFRGGKRLVSRLHRVGGGSSFVNPISPDGRYVVTGGTGGIGLKMAQWLLSKGARDLLLLARTAPAGEALHSIEDLRKRARVRFASCDVADREQLAAALREDGAPLRGVVHAAGTFEDRVVREHRWELFERVFAAKVRGAWNLHELTKDAPVDLFLLMSSASALLGGAGMANYVASNCAVDALAHYRRRHGMPALSVNWGLWADTGMAVTAGESRNRQWAEQGLARIDGDTALEALDLAIASGLPQCAVLALDWPRFLAQFPADAVPDEFEDFRSAAVAPVRVESLRQKLQGKAAPERSALLAAHVQEETARVLGIAQAGSVDIRQGFFELGMDSLTSMELRNRLQDAIGMPLPPTVAFRHSTVETLAQYLLAGLQDAPPAMETAPQEDAFADMDLAELEALLDRKLEALD
jgi:NAD(P)-dependent dehydrogenase (short-subunit alcohol dehydrogenase family)/acyl carrier protein